MHFSFKPNLSKSSLIKHRSNATEAESRQELINYSFSFAIWITILALVQFIAGIICINCFNLSALHQITRIRTKIFESLMRQEVGWYDVVSGKNNCSVNITQ